MTVYEVHGSNGRCHPGTTVVGVEIKDAMVIVGPEYEFSSKEAIPIGERDGSVIRNRFNQGSFGEKGWVRKRRRGVVS
jgi:hypothetical protein